MTERFHLLDPHHHYQFHLHHYDDDEPVPSKAIVALVAEHCLKVKVSALLLPDHCDISIIVNNQQDQCFCFRTRLLWAVTKQKKDKPNIEFQHISPSDWRDEDDGEPLIDILSDWQLACQLRVS